MLSPYARREYAKINGKSPPKRGEECAFSYKSKKLSGTFLPKINFVCHYAALAFYMKMGLKVTKVHRGMKFRQAPFMSDYIDLCTSLRIKSKTSFEKRLCKLFSNANYGKSLQNTRKYMDARITTRRKHFSRVVQHPLFTNFKIISENIAICFLRKGSVRLNRCYSAGFSILDYSKLFMGEMYYNKILPAFENNPENCEVLMSDTDSFVLRVKGGDTNEIFTKLKEIMDFSNYDSRSPLHDPVRRNIPGYFKNELEGKYVIERAVFLRSKCYSLLFAPDPNYLALLSEEERDSFLATFCTEENSLSKCKGIKRCVVEETSFLAYLDTLMGGDVFEAEQTCIRSKNHIIATVAERKRMLSAMDDKRALLECGIHSRPYGSAYLVLNGDTCNRCAKE
jgi:hypothetical protein